MSAINSIVSKFQVYLVDPIILVVFAAGFFLFVYGLVEFLWNLNEGGDNKEGKAHMVWGVVGMVIMVSVYGILSLATNTFGIDMSNPVDNSAPATNVTPGFFH